MQQKTLLVKLYPKVASCAYAKHEPQHVMQAVLVESKVQQFNFTSKQEANAAFTIKPVPVTIEVVSHICKGCGEKWFTPTRDGVQENLYLYENVE